MVSREHNIPSIDMICFFSLIERSLLLHLSRVGGSGDALMPNNVLKVVYIVM